MRASRIITFSRSQDRVFSVMSPVHPRRRSFISVGSRDAGLQARDVSGSGLFGCARSEWIRMRPRKQTERREGRDEGIGGEEKKLDDRNLGL